MALHFHARLFVYRDGKYRATLLPGNLQKKGNGGFTVGSCFFCQHVNFGFLSPEMHMSFYTSMFQVSVFLSWKQEIYVGFSYIFKGVDVAWATVDAEVYSQPSNLLPPLVGPSPLTLLSHHPNITPPSLHIGKGVLASNLATIYPENGEFFLKHHHKRGSQEDGNKSSTFF